VTPEELLERRYRRLLRLLYPREHRREYEEEMVGVLLASATAGRRAPGLREVLDLAVSALTTRWSRGAHGLREQSWRQATHAVQLFGTILLLAVSLRWVIRTQAAGIRYPAYVGHVDPQYLYLARPAAWLLVLILVLGGWRRLAVPAALIGLLAEAVPPIWLDRGAPLRLLDGYWILVCAAVVTTASALLATDGGRRIAEEGRRRIAEDGRVPRGTTLVAFGGTLIAFSGAGTLLPGSLGSGVATGGVAVAYAVLGVYAAAALLVVAGVLRLPPAVLRRMIVAAVPVLVTWPLVRIGVGGPIEHDLRAPEPVLLGALQWSALVLVPLAAMWVAAALNRRLEQSRAGSPSV
jgi:hypothetical protein